MLKSIIRTLLQKFIDDIDSDNCNITMEQQNQKVNLVSITWKDTENVDVVE